MAVSGGSPKKQNNSRRRPSPRPSPQEDTQALHNFLDAIVRGDYDPNLNMIQAALNDRNSARKDKVMEQVREVFGSDFTVSRANTNPEQRPGILSTDIVPPHDEVGGLPPAEAQPVAPPHPITEQSAELQAPPAGPDPLAASVHEANMGIESRGARFDIGPGQDL